VNTGTTTNPRRARLYPLLGAMVAVSLAMFALPTLASAKSRGVDGIQAATKRGTLHIKGTKGADAVALRLQAGDPTRVEVDVGDDDSAEASFARKRLSAIDVRMRGGDDSVRIDDANGGLTDTLPTTIAGGDGDDALNGGLGAETYGGGKGKDRVDGGIGNDTASLGAGQDTFIWDPGDGSDAIEGRNGRDAMLFNGAAAGETVSMAAVGGRLVFLRQPANVTMDTDDVEVVQFNALGGPDSITVSNLAGTDVTAVRVDLAAALGGASADGLVDEVIVNATNGDDVLNIDGSESGADATGLATAVSLTHADPTDKLSVNTLGGTDDVQVNGVEGVLEVLVDGAPV
jgi:hypothetical protein